MGVLMMTLVGCSHNLAYLREAQTTSPIVVPANVSIKPLQSYYPVPNAPTVITTQAPSMEPPGSDLQRFKKAKHTTMQAQQTTELPAVAETQTNK
jgi:hypothetical protein